MTFAYNDNGVYVIETETQKGMQEMRLSSLEARKVVRQLIASGAIA